MHLIEAVQKRQGERQRDRETGLYLRATVSRAMQMGLPLPEDVGADGGRRRGAEARGGGGRWCFGDGASRRYCAQSRSARVCDVGGVAAAVILVPCAAGPHLFI
jgi:hypothetical protein